MDASIIAEFLNELEGYLPELRRCLDVLRADRTDQPAADELHRISHTIKGAAAMIGLDGLSSAGELLEKTMEKVLSGDLVMNEELLSLLHTATDRLEFFCQERRAGKQADGALSADLAAAFAAKLQPAPPKKVAAPAPDSIAGILDQLLTPTDEESEEEVLLLEDELENGQQSHEAVDIELLACFAKETEEHADNIALQLEEMRTAVTAEIALSEPLREHLHSLRHSVHTIKGAAAVIGIEPVAAWGHQFEDFLDWLHDESPTLGPQAVAAMQDGADILARLADDSTSALAAEEQAVLERFQEIMTSAEPAAKAAPVSEQSEQVPAEDLSTAESVVEDLFSEEKETEAVATFFDELTDSGSGEDVPTDAASGETEELLLPDEPSVNFFTDDQEAADDPAADLFSSEPETAAKDMFSPAEPPAPAEKNTEDSGTEAVDPELLACFAEETGEHLENIDQQLREMKAAVTDETPLSDSLREPLHSLRRSVHTLKGAAAVIGIEPVAAWGHQFEDYLDWLHDESPTLGPQAVEIMQDSADILARLAENPAADTAAEQEELAARFQAASETASSSSAAPPEKTEDLPSAAEEDIFFADAVAEEDEPLFDDLFADDNDSDSLFAEAAEPAEEAIDPELLECFAEETGEHLENIDLQLKELRTAVPAETPLSDSLREPLHSLRRSVHTLKGAAAVIGIEPVAAWGHHFEDYLDWLHDESPTLGPQAVEIMQDSADVLARLAENPAADVIAEQEELAARFQAVMTAPPQTASETVSSSSAAPPEKTEDLPSAAEEDIFFAETREDQAEEDEPLFDDLFADDNDSDSLFAEAAEPAEEAIDPELLACFAEETGEHLENIDLQLKELRTAVPAETPLSDSLREPLHSLRRSVHTLKGAAAVIGIEPVAAWGHQFEDYLDWLHDESPTLGPQAVAAMQDGADLLVRITEKPAGDFAEGKETVAAKFRSIMAGEAVPLPPEQAESADEPVPSVSAHEQQVSGVRKVNTLRVEISKIDQVVGLSGDMVINLSSFEASMSAMGGTLNELGMILQRLKSINHSLEAGYELATIPYLRGMGDSGQGGIAEDFDPLEMDRYSELNILIRSLSEAVSDLDSIMNQSALENVAWQKTVERQARVLKDIQNRMIGLRMTPLSVLSARMHRTVREAERSTGNPAQLVIEGESIMMDTRVWDTMADALMHILRNSVAHGGNSDRQLTVEIKAERRGGQFSLRIKDDGKGLNYEAIRAKGMKLYPLENVSGMSEEKLASLIFRHGFSSAGTISGIAGRGVGMDVVRDAVELLNGSVEISSVQGQGLELFIRLPVAVAQLQAVLVRLAGQIYAVPMHDINSAARIRPEDIAGSHYETESGKRLPLINPAAIAGFHLGQAADLLPESEQAVLLIRAGSRQAALFCEQIIGQRDIVFKDLGSHLHNVSCIAGMTIMGEGSLVPILQTDDLLTKWTELSAAEVEAAIEEQVEEKSLHVLVVDDSISVRKVVSNFLIQQGWLPSVARNGIEALERIREERPDLVLLDVEMPRMNGFEVLQALQSQPEFQDIPVVMLTSRSADKYREKASQLGARGFMTKPFKEDEAIELIRSMASGQMVAEVQE
ncbi:histidine kinase [Candidatus Electronema halotolerans]